MISIELCAIFRTVPVRPDQQSFPRPDRSGRRNAPPQGIIMPGRSGRLAPSGGKAAPRPTGAVRRQGGVLRGTPCPRRVRRPPPDPPRPADAPSRRRARPSRAPPPPAAPESRSTRNSGILRSSGNSRIPPVPPSAREQRLPAPSLGLGRYEPRSGAGGPEDAGPGGRGSRRARRPRGRRIRRRRPPGGAPGEPVREGERRPGAKRRLPPAVGLARGRLRRGVPPVPELRRGDAVLRRGEEAHVPVDCARATPRIVLEPTGARRRSWRGRHGRGECPEAVAEGTRARVAVMDADGSRVVFMEGTKSQSRSSRRSSRPAAHGAGLPDAAPGLRRLKPLFPKQIADCPQAREHRNSSRPASRRPIKEQARVDEDPGIRLRGGLPAPEEPPEGAWMREDAEHGPPSPFTPPGSGPGDVMIRPARRT
jgi:hypothetical protein